MLTNKTFLISDTHLGHDAKMVEYCSRPENSSELILKNLETLDNEIIRGWTEKNLNTLIHCGDFCIGKDEYWHTRFMYATNNFDKRILVRGNHDRKTKTWYLDHGWDDVVDDLVLAVGNGRILFTHKPVEKSVARGMTATKANIHGHWHNKDHSSDLPWYDKAFHKKISCEDFDYKPVLIEEILKI